MNKIDNAKLIEEINDFIESIDKLILADIDHKSYIGDMISYYFSLKSKFIRSKIFFFIRRIKKLRINNTCTNLAACIELLHNSTLMHDDVIDNNSIRRKNKSLNKKYGNRLSILCGDILLSKTLMYGTKINNIDIIKALSNTTSLIIEGEIEQSISLNKHLDMNIYISIIRKKTAELFGLTCLFASIDENLSIKNKLSNELYDFGINYGIYFQIKDDLNDIKKHNEDFTNKIVTIIPILLSKESKEVHALINNYYFNNDSTDKLSLYQYQEWINKYNIVEKGNMIAERYLSNSFNLLDGFEFYREIIENNHYAI